MHPDGLTGYILSIQRTARELQRQQREFDPRALSTAALLASAVLGLPTTVEAVISASGVARGLANG